MKKPVIGVIALIAIVGIGIVLKFALFPDTPDGLTKPMPNSSQSGPAVATSAKPRALSVAGVGGYSLPQVDLGGEKVPLVKIPLVTWGGYAALIAANGGSTKPTKDSSFYRLGKFAVELVRVESPQDQLIGFAKGEYPIIWSTMDTMPLIFNALKTDKRVIPQTLGIFDWSFGGDGIIVRGDIKTPKDLKGKRIVVAGNTPSNFFLLWLLSQSGLLPSDVQMQFTDDAIAAKDAFLGDNKIDACVTWSPFLYEITDPKSPTFSKGSRLLITSKDANQLIADIYLTRMDFLREKKDLVAAFTQGMFEGWEAFQVPVNQQRVYQSMAELFELKGGSNEAQAMLGDVYLANFPETQMFFDPENSVGAYKIFYMAQEYYKGIGSLDASASYEAEAVINTDFLAQIKKKNLFSNQVNKVKNSFNKQSGFSIADLESMRTVLAEDLQIYFEPQKTDFPFDSTQEEVQKNKVLLKKVAEQMQVLGTTVLKLIGHLDTSKVEEFKKRGQSEFIEASGQAKLTSKRRAEFIKSILVQKYGADPTRIITEGKGWEQPADTVDQARNRRVEIRFFSFE